MSYVVGLSGTHGTGKSSIIQGVKGLGYTVNESQLSRAAQKELGWDKLSHAEESIENMWMLQDAILGAMYDRDFAISESKELTFVERTPADVWAYTAMWCERLDIDIHSSRARLYRAQCQQLMHDHYAYFIYVPMTDAVPFKEEPNRADLKSRVFVAKTIEQFLMDAYRPNHFITTTTSECRTAEAAACMELAKFLTGEKRNDND